MTNDKPLVLLSGLPQQIPDSDFVNPGSGVQYPNGTAAAPSAAFNTNYGWFYDTTNVGMGLTIGGTELAWFTASGGVISRDGGALSLTLQAEAAATLLVVRYSTNANAPQISARKARGTIASPATVVQNDIVFQQIGSGYGATTFQTSTNILGRVIEPTPSDIAMGGQVAIFTSPLGSVTATEVARFESGTGFSMYGANPVVDANRTLISGQSTTSGLPTNVTAGLRYVSDLEGGQGFIYGGSTAFRSIANQQIAQSTITGTGVLSRMTGYFNFSQRAVVNNTMQKLSDAGLLTKLLGLWVHAVPTNSTDALLNWITPGTRNAAIVGSPTWTANQGFTGDGSTGLIDTVASLTTFGATINNASVGCYVRTAGTGSAKAVMGCDNVAQARRMYFQTFTSGALVVRCNDQTNDNFTPSQYTGMFVMTRGGSTGFNASVNDAAATTVTRTSVTQTNNIAFLGTLDSTGSEFSNAQISFSFIGTNLSTTDVANLRWILVDYYLVQIGAVAADYTVATLPLAGTPPKASRVFVTDALAPVFAATLTGGGAIYTPVYTDNTNWRAG